MLGVQKKLNGLGKLEPGVNNSEIGDTYGDLIFQK